MSEGGMAALVAYRMEQAREVQEEAAILLRETHCRGAVNRAYYAMFYALQALAVTRDVRFSKHSGLISFFDRELVRTGVVERNLSRWLHRLFDLRQDADYGDTFVPSEDQAREAVEHANAFVTRIAEIVADAGVD